MIKTPINPLVLRRLKLRTALVAIADALTQIEESGPPTPALHAVCKQLRETRQELLTTLTGVEKDAAR